MQISIKDRLNQAGDTLVEVVMSIAILSVILVTAYTVANVSAHTGMQAREVTEATQLAQSQAELLRTWRDYEVKQPSPNLHTNFFTPLSACSTYTNGCTILENGLNRFVACRTGSGPCPNLVNNLYTINVTETTHNTSAGQLADIRINVGWPAAGYSSIPNVAKLRFILTDTSGYAPIDCSNKPENCL